MKANRENSDYERIQRVETLCPLQWTYGLKGLKGNNSIIF